MLRKLLTSVLAFAVGLNGLSMPMVWAQNGSVEPGPLIIDTGRLDHGILLKLDDDKVPVPAPATPDTEGAEAAKTAPFTLQAVQVEGATVFDNAALSPAWQPFLGQTVSDKQIADIADTVGEIYGKAGYALFTVIVPQQSFENGIARVRVVEGYVQGITIEGDTDDADLGLLKAYAAKIARERPLTKKTLERYLILMNEIPGLMVGSRFDAVPNAAGAVTLGLTIKRKPYQVLGGINNLGAAMLDRIQIDTGAVANSFFQQGDRTQATYDMAGDLRSFKYYGLSQSEPIGSEGTMEQISAGYLHTAPHSWVTMHGDAYTLAAQTTYPMIRSNTQALTLSGDFETLDSNNAVLGQTIASDHTRVLRAGSVYGWADTPNSLLAGSVILSQGLNIIDARTSPYYGAPDFTKVNFRVNREQPLFDNDIILRPKLYTQYSAAKVPSSEQFTYGGAEFGRGFDPATFNGDRGIAASLEIAYRIPDGTVTEWSKGFEVYGFYDWAKLWNDHSRILPAVEEGTSAGLGTRMHLTDVLLLQFEAAAPRSAVASGVVPGWPRDNTLHYSFIVKATF